MARRVFFSFHYEGDIWKANQVRMSNVVAGPDVAGFFDHSEYEDAKKRGADAIARMILRHLEHTTVTVVLIGHDTAARPWVRYEISESLKRKNGLLGIYVHHLRDPTAARSTLLTPVSTMPLPAKPSVPPGIVFPAYPWDKDLSRFAAAIEQAGRRADAWRVPTPPTPPSRRLPL
jgi:hypothetical protein